MLYDIVVHNGIIVTVNSTFDIIENGIVCIKDGLVAKIAVQSKDLPLPSARDMIDAGGGIIMPGLINTHTHLPMTLFRGLADDLPLDTWLNENIFPAEGKYINPETVRWGTLLACAELLLSGTTTCCDGYFLEDSVAQAAHESGIRAILGHGVIDFPAPGVPNPADNLKTAVKYAEKWRNTSGRIHPSIFCHSPYTCSQNTLETAKHAARDLGILFQIHAAETRSEGDQIDARHKRTPIQYLDEIGILDSQTLLIHCVWVDNKDIEIIAARRTGVSHCPQSNMKLAGGIAPIPQLINKGIPVGLGTDGCASNNNMDLFQEMDITAKLHKADTLEPTTMAAATVLKAATIDAAKAIGLGRQIGSLEKGKQADLIIVNTRTPHLTPLYHPESHIVYAAKGSDVSDVVISGKILVKDKKLIDMDLDRIITEVNEIASAVRDE